MCYNEVAIRSPSGYPNLHAANQFSAKHMSEDVVLNEGHDALFNLAVRWTHGAAYPTCKSIYQPINATIDLFTI